MGFAIKSLETTVKERQAKRKECSIISPNSHTHENEEEPELSSALGSQ